MAKQTVITASMLKGKTKAELVTMVIAMSKPEPEAKAAKVEDTRTWAQKRADYNAEHPEVAKANAAYNAWYKAHFAKDWAKATAKMGKRTSEQNKAIAKDIRNTYRAKFGLKLEA